MPLIKSKSNAARSKNIAELIHSGYKSKQAAAIGYSEQRRMGGKDPKADPSHASKGKDIGSCPSCKRPFKE